MSEACLSVFGSPSRGAAHQFQDEDQIVENIGLSAHRHRHSFVHIAVLQIRFHRRPAHG